MNSWNRFKYTIWHLLAFSRIPGNWLSFWIRERLHWSKGRPDLYQEPKDGLFDYLGEGAARAEARSRDLSDRYGLDPLAAQSTVSLYRKCLYLIDCLEKAAEGLPGFPESPGAAGGPRAIRAVDVGAQDWHYAFGLERWLRHWQCPGGRAVALKGIELDGHGIYSDLHSRRDYALAYAQQTGNPGVIYETGDFLKSKEIGCDLVTLFYPFVTRYALLLWGLPLRFFSPAGVLARSAASLRPGGWLLVFNHTAEEHRLFLEAGRGEGALELLREGPVRSNLVDFHEDVEDRRFSIWRKREVGRESGD